MIHPSYALTLALIRDLTLALNRSEQHARVKINTEIKFYMERPGPEPETY